MTVFLVNRFFHPDTAATSQVLADLVEGLEASLDLVVVTSRQRHDDPAVRLSARDTYGQAAVCRLRATRFGRGSRLRALDYLTFHLAVAGFLLRRVRSGDVVILKTDPPLLQLVNTAVIRLKGARIANWLQDIYPEIAERLGLFPGPAWLAHGVRAWRDRALGAADVNVVVGEPMRRYLASRGVGRVRVISNWADEREINPVDRAKNRLRRQWGLAERFVVMYSGNLGRAHAFTEITGAAQRLADRADIVFVIVGSGAESPGLRSFVAANGLKNWVFLPHQPREMLAQSLGAADLHLVSLKPGMEELVTPSKLYGVLAAGRPVAFIGEPGSAISRLVEEEDIGVAVRHGETTELAKAIERLADDPAVRERHGRRARALFERRFTRTRGVELWRALIDTIAEPESAREAV